MNLSIASLNSGSNGNCYYIGNEEEAIFIDAGLSCAETEIRMKRLGLNMERIKGIFISHEHSDHILGLSAIVQKYKVPVFINSGTLREVRGKRLRAFVQLTESHKPVSVGGLRITPFPKKHDARDPHSFIVSYRQTTVGIFTDIGQPCEQVVHYFGQCHAAFLEANYDEDLLQNGKYPYFLKNRIRGGNGHLSNHQALDLFKTHRSAFLSHLLLSHLSRENNSPELVRSLFDSFKTDTRVIIASRYEESLVYSISHSAVAETDPDPLLPAYGFSPKKRRNVNTVLEQLRLF
ncbi:MAG TPA: MBL fold metallo-hydrolase [Puia sp.]|jgi:phosphoribosyl 1,2-cyclic phosphodiesterase